MTVHTSLEIRQSDLVPKCDPVTLRKRIWQAARKPEASPKPVPKPKPKPVLVRPRQVKRRMDQDQNQHVVDYLRWKLAEESGAAFESLRRKSMMEIALEALVQFPGVTIEDIKGQSRRRHINAARHFVAYSIYAAGKASFPEIGRFLGGRDHTTSLHSVKLMEKIHGKIDRGIWR